MTTKQAAEALNLSDAHVRRIIGEGKLRATRFGHAWVVRPSDLEAYRQSLLAEQALPTKRRGPRPKALKP
jgi:excisionase family DNA binding protein